MNITIELSSEEVIEAITKKIRELGPFPDNKYDVVLEATALQEDEPGPLKIKITGRIIPSSELL